MTANRKAYIAEIRHFPEVLASAVSGLNPKQLINRSLPEEWTVAQTVHHLVDSHMNSYIRCKLMVTEEHPTLKPYDEAKWAQFADAQAADLSASLAILSGLHQRWATFWENLPAETWARTGYHPESGIVSLDDQLRLYVEHGRNHLEQLRRVLGAQ